MTPDAISLTKNDALVCAMGEDGCKGTAKWLYESPGMGNGPTVSVTCDFCKELIIRLLGGAFPQVRHYFTAL